MSWWVRLLLFIAGQSAKRRALRELKRGGVIAYLRFLQTARYGLMGALVGFFVLQTVMFAFVGALVTGLWLWDYDLHTKLLIAFILSAGVFLTAVAAFFVLFSQRLWYRVSGAEKMVDDLRDSA